MTILIEFIKVALGKGRNVTGNDLVELRQAPIQALIELFEPFIKVENGKEAVIAVYVFIQCLHDSNPQTYCHNISDVRLALGTISHEEVSRCLDIFKLFIHGYSTVDTAIEGVLLLCLSNYSLNNNPVFIFAIKHVFSGKIDVQVLNPDIRSLLFQTLHLLLSEHADLCETEGGSTFIRAVIGIVDEQREPENVILAFKVNQLLTNRLSISKELTEPLFESLSCYFPLLFTPPPNCKVSEAQLENTLNDSLLSSLYIQEYTLDLALSKLISPSSKVRKASLNLLSRAFSKLLDSTTALSQTHITATISNLMPVIMDIVTAPLNSHNVVYGVAVETLHPLIQSLCKLLYNFSSLLQWSLDTKRYAMDHKEYSLECIDIPYLNDIWRLYTENSSNYSGTQLVVIGQIIFAVVSAHPCIFFSFIDMLIKRTSYFISVQAEDNIPHRSPWLIATTQIILRTMSKWTDEDGNRLLHDLLYGFQYMISYSLLIQHFKSYISIEYIQSQINLFISNLSMLCNSNVNLISYTLEYHNAQLYCIQYLLHMDCVLQYRTEWPNLYCKLLDLLFHHSTTEVDQTLEVYQLAGQKVMIAISNSINILNHMGLDKGDLPPSLKPYILPNHTKSFELLLEVLSKCSFNRDTAISTIRLFIALLLRNDVCFEQRLKVLSVFTKLPIGSLCANDTVQDSVDFTYKALNFYSIAETLHHLIPPATPCNALQISHFYTMKAQIIAMLLKQVSPDAIHHSFNITLDGIASKSIQTVTNLNDFSAFRWLGHLLKAANHKDMRNSDLIDKVQFIVYRLLVPSLSNLSQESAMYQLILTDSMDILCNTIHYIGQVGLINDNYTLSCIHVIYNPDNLHLKYMPTSLVDHVITLSFLQYFLHQNEHLEDVLLVNWITSMFNFIQLNIESRDSLILVQILSHAVEDMKSTSFTESDSNYIALLKCIHMHLVIPLLNQISPDNVLVCAHVHHYISILETLFEIVSRTNAIVNDIVSTILKYMHPLVMPVIEGECFTDYYSAQHGFKQSIVTNSRVTPSSLLSHNATLSDIATFSIKLLCCFTPYRDVLIENMLSQREGFMFVIGIALLTTVPSTKSGGVSLSCLSPNTKVTLCNVLGDIAHYARPYVVGTDSYNREIEVMLNCISSAYKGIIQLLQKTLENPKRRVREAAGLAREAWILLKL